MINTNKKIIVDILRPKSKKGSSWSEEKYSALITLDKEATVIALPLHGSYVKITSTITLINAIKFQIA